MKRQWHMVPTAVVTRSKLVPLTFARPVTTAVPHNNVIRPRPAKNVGTKPHSPPRRIINHRPSPPTSNFSPKVNTIKASKVNDVMGEGFHAIPPPYTGTFMPPKHDLVFHDALTVNETVPTAFNVELSPTKHDKDLSQSNRPTAPINED
nr:hypothetical protein [Tanacetum cinerariifolium]